MASRRPIVRVGGRNVQLPAGDTLESGDVIGPSEAIDGQLGLFDGATGKLLKAGPKLTISTTAPISPAAGDLWVDTN